MVKPPVKRRVLREEIIPGSTSYPSWVQAIMFTAFAVSMGLWGMFVRAASAWGDAHGTAASVLVFVGIVGFLVVAARLLDG